MPLCKKLEEVNLIEYLKGRDAVVTKVCQDLALPVSLNAVYNDVEQSRRRVPAYRQPH